MEKSTGVPATPPSSIYAAQHHVAGIPAPDGHLRRCSASTLINADGNVPAAYNLNTLTPLTFSAVEHSPASGDQDQEYIDITNPNTLAIDLSGWQITGG